MNTEKKANKFLIAGGFIFIIAAVVFVLGAWGVASAQPTAKEVGVSDYELMNSLHLPGKQKDMKIWQLGGMT